MLNRRKYLKTTGLAALVGSALSAEAAAGAEAKADRSRDAATAGWPMRGYDPARTGYNPTATPPKSDVTVERIIDREIRQNDPNLGQVYTLLVGDGALFWFNSRTGRLTVWDRQNEAIRWEATEGISTPVLRGDELYVGHLTKSGKTRTLGVRVLSTADGSVRRTYSGVSRCWSLSVPEILPVGDTVYLRQDAVGLFALSTSDGTVRWETPIDVEQPYGYGYGEPKMVYADGNLYVRTRYGLSAIDAETGAVRWSFEAPHPLAELNFSFVATDGTVLIGDNARNLYVLDAASGTPKRTFEGDDSGWPLAAVRDELVYVTRGSELTAVGLEDGTVRWSVTDESVQRWKPTVGGDVVCAAADYKALYAFDARDGTKLWEYSEGGGKEWSYPVLVGDTVYAVGSTAVASFGGLYRIESG